MLASGRPAQQGPGKVRGGICRDQEVRQLDLSDASEQLAANGLEPFGFGCRLKFWNDQPAVFYPDITPQYRRIDGFQGRREFILDDVERDSDW